MHFMVNLCIVFDKHNETVFQDPRFIVCQEQIAATYSFSRKYVIWIMGQEEEILASLGKTIVFLEYFSFLTQKNNGPSK